MESIGAKLRKARVKKGLSLQDVYQNTRIHINVLVALEEDRADELLSPVYVKGFLKTYSKFLGLNQEAILGEYLSTTPGLPKSKLSLDKKRKRDLSKLVPNFKRVILGLSTLLAIFLCFLLVRSFVSSIQKRRLKAESALKGSSTHRIPPSKAILEPVALTIRAKEDSWLQVKSDGKIVFQKVLPKGSLERWRANEKIELWVGNAGGIELELNGKEIGPLGRKGQVIKNILITKQGLKVRK